MSEITIFEGIWDTTLEILIALLPLIAFFIYFQMAYLKLPSMEVVNMVKGVVLTFLGIVFFLQGVNIGFLPTGELIGQGMIQYTGKWLVIPVGFILGIVATFAEPAVRALCNEVEKVTAGYIPQTVLLITLSLGVGVSIALAMFRIIIGIPLIYLLLPGYGLALAVTFISKENFTSIAFDSGGVATGPMIVTFVMAFSAGVANEIEGRDPLIEGFGMVALVALIPILSVLLLGLIYSRKESEMNKSLNDEERNFSVIVTITKKGQASKVCQITKEVGAEGGTILLAKGTSVKDFRKVFGIALDEDREMVLTVVKEELEDKVFEAIIDRCELNKPGSGITFVMDLKQVSGIAHLLKGASQND